ncbi:serine hydrolase [Pullulanibacillus camelliae]|uniref:Serine hydrolase n=1 Tax=Pullulanibacillus camelliae TaxID=1707096 RepID=A0A8J2YKY1_9BACL|nr:serine hydrolase domain-containing protein [Pullulanibacillus camelliae]GGE49588.1 serine hydrolase [Pullulanibacillus camelliae]
MKPTPDDLEQRLDAFLNTMVEEKQLPGAVYAIIGKDGVIAENAVGLAHLEKRLPMTLNTVFDLASLTKICVTLPSLLLLVQKGDIDFDDPIKRFFPNAGSEVTIRHLLTHTTGFTPTVPFYQYGWSNEEILQCILSDPAAPDQKVVYSDLNFILLGFLIERITGESLDAFAVQHIFKPLGMHSTSFNPTVDLKHVAPTEWLSEKQDYQWGEVHDENALHMKGVSGHAGLFSSLADLKRFAHMLLHQGQAQHSQFLSPALLKTSQRNYTKHLNLNRGLGWQLVDDCQSPAGYLFSEGSYGHTGFTGTSLWIDPQRELALILLSNRVHIGREINMNRIRRVFHNIALSVL